MGNQPKNNKIGDRLLSKNNEPESGVMDIKMKTFHEDQETLHMYTRQNPNSSDSCTSIDRTLRSA